MFKNIHYQLSQLRLDVNEKKFINNFNNKKKNKKNNILIVAPNDYYYLCYNYLISKDQLSEFNIYGYWPYSIHVTRIRPFQKFHELKSNLYFKLLRNKYSKLYSVINLKSYWDLSNLKSLFITKLEDENMRIYAKKIFNKILNKKDILNLCIDKIYCGDLVYDTYIRFRNRPTVDIKDNFLRKIIYLAVVSIKCFRKLQKKYKFKYLYTSYATYIHYGLLVRVFLQMNVKVFSGTTMAQYNKILTKKDYYSVDNYRKFQLTFSKLKNKKQKLLSSKKMLNKIFFKNRKNLQFNDYMKVDPFRKNNMKIKKKYDGIVFLPNFFESQREWGKLIFPDFYEWIIYTCNLIKKHNLNIAIKPHPNIYFLNTESQKVVNELKNKYETIDWIDPSISNLELFKNIKCGISPWGTILWELAYFKIHPISAGEHPACKYNLGFEPRSIEQYKKILLSTSKLTVKNDISQKKILEYCYMYYIHNNDAYKNKARILNLNKIDFNSSSSLKKFINIYNNYENNL